MHQLNRSQSHRHSQSLETAVPAFGKSNLAQQSYLDVERMLIDVRPSPLRHLIEMILGGASQSQISNSPLFTALASSPASRWKERVLAAWAMGRVKLSRDEKNAAENMLMETVAPEEADTFLDRLLRGFSWGYGLMSPIALVGSIILSKFGSEMDWGVAFIQLLVTLGTLSSLFTIPYCFWWGHEDAIHMNILRAASAESLGRLHIFGSIGALSKAVYDSNALVQESSTSALMEILPLIQEDHRNEINEVSMHAMGELLSHPNSMLVVRALEALEVVGTGKMIPYVEHMIQFGAGHGLREKARKTLSVLEQRRKNELESQHLMRAAIAPNDEQDLLLRSLVTGSSAEKPSRPRSSFSIGSTESSDELL